MLSLLVLVSSVSFCVVMAKTERPEPVKRRMVGGYSPVDVEDSQAMERVQVAANFAVTRVIAGEKPTYSFLGEIPSEDGDLDRRVLQASQQVVAGMNYRMTIAMLKPDGQCVGAFKCIVYDRFGNLQVSSWGDEVPCDEVVALLKERKPEKPGPET